MEPSGDRLLKVNSISVEGLSHEETVEILQSSQDDVTLLVSQPKERLFAGNALILLTSNTHNLTYTKKVFATLCPQMIWPQQNSFDELKSIK